MNFDRREADSFFISTQLLSLVEYVFPKKQPLLCATETFVKNVVIRGDNDVPYSSRGPTQDMRCKLN